MNNTEKAEFIQYLIEHVKLNPHISERPDKYELVDTIYANTGNDKYTVHQDDGQYRFTDAVCDALEHMLDFRTDFNEVWRTRNTTWELHSIEVTETDPDKYGVRFQYIKMIFRNAVLVWAFVQDCPGDVGDIVNDGVALKLYNYSVNQLNTAYPGDLFMLTCNWLTASDKHDELIFDGKPFSIGTVNFNIRKLASQYLHMSATKNMKILQIQEVAGNRLLAVIAVRNITDTD